jgi:hypothetical protein
MKPEVEDKNKLTKHLGPEDMSVLQALRAKNRALALDRLRSEENLDEMDEHGNVALHYAAAFGYVDVIERIMMVRSDLVSAKNNEGQHPLIYAMEYGQPAAAKLLWRHWGSDHLVGQASRAKDGMTRFACYVAELCKIGVDWTLQPGEASSGFFQKNSPLDHRHHPRAREIGQELHAWGGAQTMRQAAAAVSDVLGGQAAHDLSACWHGVGDWLH